MQHELAQLDLHVLSIGGVERHDLLLSVDAHVDVAQFGGTVTRDSYNGDGNESQGDHHLLHDMLLVLLARAAWCARFQ
ncbi:MAG: hypothetical protein KC468_36925 [Myxococcales bacterium]|nr:hypothetical protein [Myxococcales bacterium]